MTTRTVPTGYLTVVDAMNRLGLARRTVFKYLKEGKLRRYGNGTGKLTLIPEADVTVLLTPVSVKTASK